MHTMCLIYMWHADKYYVTSTIHKMKAFSSKKLIYGSHPPFTSPCFSSGTTTVTSSEAASLKTWSSLCSTVQWGLQLNESRVSSVIENKFHSWLLNPFCFFHSNKAWFEWWQGNMFKPAAFFRSCCRWFCCRPSWVRIPNNFSCLFYAACRTRWVEFNKGNEYQNV